MLSDQNDTRKDSLERWLYLIDPELLAELLGRELLRDPDHPTWGDERFVRWLAVKAREEDERGRRLSDEECQRRGNEFMARAHARKLRVSRNSAGHNVRQSPHPEWRPPRPV